VPKYLLQTHHFAGIYSNPFKPNRQGLKFTKWVTIRSADDRRQAELLWEEFNARRNKVVMDRYRVTYRGKVIVSDRGAVYDTVKDGSGRWGTYFVKKLVGAEEL